MSRVILIFVLILSSSRVFAETAAWNSLLVTDQTPWVDENAKAIKLSDFQDRIVVLTTGYAQCKRTCPLITIKKLQELQAVFSEKGLKADIFFISLDPDSDTSEILLKFKEKIRSAGENWHFLRAEPQKTRSFAKLLGVGGYWTMDDHIQHTFKITILDPTDKQAKILDWDHRKIENLF